MDVSGKAPAADVGKYFRNNVWWWRPLWTYIEEIAPDLAGGISGQTNDGEGLDDEGAQQLTAILTDEIASGRTEKYARKRAQHLESLPDEPCEFCAGTGRRHDGLTSGRDTADFACNACGGAGMVRPWSTHYPFDVENVVAFRDFVAASGGFAIW